MRIWRLAADAAFKHGRVHRVRLVIIDAQTGGERPYPCPDGTGTDDEERMYLTVGGLTYPGRGRSGTG